MGIGLTSGVSAAEVLAAVDAVLPGTGGPVRLATLDSRSAEPGLVAAAARRGWPLTGHPAADLAAVRVPSPSAAVADRVGTPSVAEAAALLGGGVLVVGKTVHGRVTVAVARPPDAGALPDPDPDRSDRGGPVTTDAAGEVLHPVGLRLARRHVVVVGGGATAHRGVAGLLAAGAVVTVVSPAVTPALESLATAGALTWRARPYAAGDLDGAWFALAATGHPGVDAAVADEAERSRTFCTRADDPALASAALPVTGRAGDLAVAVHGAADPRRAAGVRDALLAGLGDGTLPVRSCGGGGGAGSVVLVGGGPGDPGLITVRGRQALAEADVVLVDHLAPQSLLTSLAPGAEVIDASKLPRGRFMAQERINALLVEHARAGKRVVRLKGGDPFVFGRGFEELQACTAAGIPVEVVPGTTSAVAVPALAGIPVTHRGLTHEFVVVSGHLPPGHPQSLVDWAALGRLRGTLVVLMGVETAPAIAAALVEHGRAPGTPVAVVADGSTATQWSLRTTLAELPGAIGAAGIRPPAVWVVGDVVDLAAPGPVPATAAAAAAPACR
ncbi:uroporphyrinogen-III C-methyltransferase [Blastococcus sp. VKM Ac-2987]|uniref:uroporphyrinogen-III C-methyltransferase n=1 Tax=Blastococcus sp. VKM Ac-2987 TaxID=3004141 RepID=UPI0022ABC1AB|nr:uroporphyrinogen-III C-methyltransferase [Blastococcus sp. VKM Ac-2987]MCZ2860475.1 uroporphyrinogen-III C-methyltransferase [Blastococcus sp. VKM Ac-2987]